MIFHIPFNASHSMGLCFYEICKKKLSDRMVVGQRGQAENHDKEQYCYSGLILEYP